MKSELKRYKEEINRELISFFDEERNSGFIKENYKVISDYINEGGKRIRPIALVKAYESLKGKNKEIFLPAIGLEFFHNSTLCHDDIMDEDEKRRNMLSNHKAFQKKFLERFKETPYKGDIFHKESMRFGVSLGIIAGNLFNFLGAKCFYDSKFPEAIKLKAVSKIINTIRQVNHGQILDMLYEKEVTNEEGYMEMITKKTAVLLAASFELGAIFAQAKREVCDSFYQYGINLGIAFQIADDLLDINPEGKKGNSLGSDIEKGKQTILAIKARDKGVKITTHVESMIRAFNDCGAVDYAKTLAKEKIEIAKGKIEKIGERIDEKAKKFFLDFADYMVERNI